MGTGEVLKFFPLAAIAAGAVATVSYFGWGPYGMMRPKPPICAATETCVIVAGISGDVVVGPGAGNQPIGFDINDEAATRLVYWLERAKPEGVDVQVYKYPGEIEMPAPGVRSDPALGRNALRRAREIGTTYHARLVIVGTLSGNSIAMAFINPNSTYPELSNEQLGVYDISSVEWPDRFQEDYDAALQATFNVANDNAVVFPVPIPPGQRRIAPPPLEPEIAPDTPASSVPVVLEPPVTTTTPFSVVVATYVRPHVRFLNEAHPVAAYARGIGDTVHLRCRVTLQAELTDCRSLDSGADPWGFRPAAIALAQQHMSGEPQKNDGVAVDTGEVEFAIEFPRPR